MRRFNVKHFCCVGILTVLMVSIGCGSGDGPLEEVGQRYTASIMIQDNEEDATLTVDVIQSVCDDGKLEDYGRASAVVTFTVDDEAPGITLHGYTLEYIPLGSEDGTGTVVMPPTLDSPGPGGNLLIDIPSGGTYEFEITCISVDTKEEYRRKVGWLYYWETPGGQIAISDKADEVAATEAEINATNTAITAKKYEIANAEVAEEDTTVLELDLEILEGQLETLQTQLATLAAELDAMPYSFWAMPELADARYKVRITFEFEDEYGEERTMVREDTVWLGPVDNCAN